MRLSGLAIAILFATGLRLMAAPASGSAPPSLTLRDCLEMALVHNPELRTASQQFLSAEGQSIRLHAILYPSVNSQAITTPLTFYVQINETFYSRATLPQIRLSRLTREQAFLNYRQALVDVLFQVRQAFTTELGARAQTALGKELVAKRQAALKAGQQLFEAGRLHRSDILPLQVLSGLAQQGNTLALLTEQQGTLSLQLAVGTELPANAQLVGNLDDTAPEDLNIGKLTADALQNRMDLKLLENAKLSADQQIEIDLKNAYPVVGFSSNSALQPPAFLPGTGSYDIERDYDEPETQRLAGNTQLPLSLYVTWLIFDGGNLAGIKAGDKAQIASQQVAIDALRKSIPGEIAGAVAAVQAERSTLLLLHDQLSASEDEKQTNVDYDAGRVRLLDKVNLETDIVRQQQLRLASQIRLSLALAALDHALGRGLEVPRSAKP